MPIPEPILVVYSEPPKAIATTDLRQARVDEFLALRSLQPKSRKAYQADLRIFMDWCDLTWVNVSRRKVTQFKAFLLKERELALSSVNRVLRTLKLFYRWMLLSEYVMNDLAEKTGIDLHPHRGRHAFATNLIVKYELDTSLVMELTRHRDVRSFRRYTNRKNKIAAKRAFLKAAETLTKVNLI